MNKIGNPEINLPTVELTGRELAHRARAAVARGISIIFEEKNHASRARGAAARV